MCTQEVGTTTSPPGDFECPLIDLKHQNLAAKLRMGKE
jgi:hypothetical protein